VLFRSLIKTIKPARIFGEQVASKDALAWLDLVYTDLEGAGYTVWAANLPACGFGAPHIRSRLWFMAYTQSGRERAKSAFSRAGICSFNGGESLSERMADTEKLPNGAFDWQSGASVESQKSPGGRSLSNRLENTGGDGRRGRSDGNSPGDGREVQAEGRSSTSGLVNAEGGIGGLPILQGRSRQACIEPIRGGETGQLGNAGNARLQGGEQCGTYLGEDERGSHSAYGPTREPSPGPTNGFWKSSEWLCCRDGKARPIPQQPNAESILFGLVDGFTGIMGAGWNNIVQKVQEGIVQYASKTNSCYGEILRAMRHTVESEEISGRRPGIKKHFSHAPLLFFALCQLEGELGKIYKCCTQGVPCAQRNILRDMWKNNTRRSITSCSSCQWKYPRQQTGKSSYFLRKLPHEEPQSQKVQKMPVLQKSVAQTWNVPEALSALGKIWGSILDQEEKAGNRSRICNCEGLAHAIGLFPLSLRYPGRVGHLRAYGNAICAPVAIEWIKACMSELAISESPK
jgi:hypothetical protein